MTDRNDDLPDLDIEWLSRQNHELKEQVGSLRKFRFAHWLVGTLGIIIFSQAISFGRWNEYISLENNFNNHAFLLAGCGLAAMFIAVAAFALHKRLERIEKVITGQH